MTTVIDETTKEQPYFMVPFPRNDDFIGESHVASWLKDYQQGRMKAGKSHHTGHFRLALCGLGGIGYVLGTRHYVRP
jgi:hypothetical protein